MKKINYLLLFTFLAIITFHACKTWQKGQDQLGKNQDTIVGQATDTLFYVFSKEGVLNMKKKNPHISLIPSIPYSSDELYKELESNEGNEKLDSYVTMAKKSGTQTTQQEIIEKNTQYYLNALETGEETWPPDNKVFTSNSTGTYLKKIEKLSPLIEQLFEGYTIFYLDQLDYHQPPHYEPTTIYRSKVPTTIYRGKLIPLHELINVGLRENGDKLNLSFKEKLQVYLSLYFCLDIKFSIKEIIDIPGGDDDLLNPNYKIILDVDGQEKQCLISYKYKYKRFYGLDVFNNENKYQGGSHPFNY